jgi:hypothetical protein
LEVLPDDSLSAKGPGRASNGNFVLTEFVAAIQPGDAAEPQAVEIAGATATFAQNDFGQPVDGGSRFTIAGAIDADAGGNKAGWAVMPKFGQTHEAVFETKTDIPGGEAATLVVKLLQNYEPSKHHTIGRFRVSVTTSPRPVRAGGGLPAEIATILAVAADERDDKQRDALATYYRSIAPELNAVRLQLKETEAAKNRLEESLPVTLATVAVEPRMVRVLPRGNWMDDSGESVTPGVPEFLPQPPAKEGRLTRLDLARGCS